MQLPDYNLNGSRPADLAAHLRDALDALGKARDALAMTRPNGRDYATPERLALALAEHEARIAALAVVESDLRAMYRAAHLAGVKP